MKKYSARSSAQMLNEIRNLRDNLLKGKVSVEEAKILERTYRHECKIADLELKHATLTKRLVSGSDVLPAFRRVVGK